MPRQLRLEYEGAVYHVMARSDRREAIYRDDRDRLAWVDYLHQVCRRTEWRAYGWMLMGNHYHLLVTPFADAVNTKQLMEEVCERENLKEALRRVRANKGSAGIDRMTVDGLPRFLKEHWPTIREQLLEGTYQPQPVLRVEIPKPDGGVRKLGIATVLDRFVQQAVMQVLQKRWDRRFSKHSYGFRPGKSAHQAVAQAQKYIVEGYGWVVDLDLEKFFDRVNHDKLMGQVAAEGSDLINVFSSFADREDERRSARNPFAVR